MLLEEGKWVNSTKLIRFTSVKHKRQEWIVSFRHSSKNELPQLVLVSLIAQSKTRQKKPLKCVATKGLSITCDRVLDIRPTISK